jgi:hypothetical protein
MRKKEEELNEMRKLKENASYKVRSWVTMNETTD